MQQCWDGRVRHAAGGVAVLLPSVHTSPLSHRPPAAPCLRPQGEKAPGSAVEFEQLLLSAPNSSFVWIKYFAFLISTGELDHARELAERALQTIHYRCGSHFRLACLE